MQNEIIDLSEVFDSKTVYPAINLKPKTKIPQVWNIRAPGTENLVAAMVSFLSKGDAIKQVKQGDKFVHVFLMSLSNKGNTAELKDGLGSDPIGALNSIFDVVYEQVKKLKMDAVMFRFPAKKMKGQEKTLQRIIKRLTMQRTGGKFIVLDDLYNFKTKHSYILIYRKSKPLEDISGIPGIDTDIYTKVESKVGDVYINKQTGKQVPKTEAIAASIAAEEEPRNDRAVINRIKLSRSDVFMTQSSEFMFYNNTDFDDIQQYLYDVPVRSVETVSPSNHVAEVSSKAKESINFFAEQLLDSSSLDYKKTKYKLLDIAKQTVPNDPEGKALSFLENELPGLMAKIDPLNYLDGMINVLKEMYSYFGITSSQPGKEEVFQFFTKQMELIENAIREEYTNHSLDNNFTEAQRKSIGAYTSTAYSFINDFLIGLDTADSTVRTHIDNLDEAFINNPSRLPKGTTLYRYQGLTNELAATFLETGVFYFNNYVSTSLLVPGLNYITQAINKDTGFTFANNDDNIETLGKQARVRVRFVITNADKIGVIIPGSSSDFPTECEVILPRGTMFKLQDYTISELDEVPILIAKVNVMEPDMVKENYEDSLEPVEPVIDVDGLKSDKSTFADFVASYKKEDSKKAVMRDLATLLGSVEPTKKGI